MGLFGGRGRPRYSAAQERAEAAAQKLHSPGLVATVRTAPDEAGPGFWSPERQAMAQPVIRGARAVAPLAAGLAPLAAMAIPAVAAGMGSYDQYGEAGQAVSAASALAGGIAGGLAGRYGGAFLSEKPSNRWGLRTGGATLGALMGAGMGAGAGGLVNTAAQGLVNRADTGEPGFGADIGRALDRLGYRSTADMEQAALNRMEASPAYQAIKRQKEVAEAQRRAALTEQLYLQALAQSVLNPS